MKIVNLCLTGLMLCAAALANAAAVTDVTGRTIEIDLPVKRFVISEGRYISSLALAQPDDPVRGLLGMLSPLSWSSPSMERELFEKFPHARDIPLFGGGDESTVSVEKIIELNPQVALFGVQDHGPGARAEELLSQLEKAGIKVLFIDFRMNPLTNTIPSLELIAKVLGQEETASHYIEYYKNKLQHIRETAALAETKPTVFLQAHPGRMPCCRGMADGMLGPFIGLVGGHNIADAVAPGPTAAHTAEFLLVENPDVWIGTASGTHEEFIAGKSPVAAGPGISRENAIKSLQKYLDNPQFQPLSAVENGRAHVIWHDLYNSPFNIIAVEAFAKWIQPELFSTADPDQTGIEIYRDFLPFSADAAFTATAPKP